MKKLTRSFAVALAVVCVSLSALTAPVLAHGSHGHSHGSQNVAQIQRALADCGHKVGPIDGIWGPRTRAALRAVADQQRMAFDGRSVSPALMERVNLLSTMCRAEAEKGWEENN